LCLCRQPSDEELERVKQLAEQQLAAFQSQPEAAGELLGTQASQPIAPSEVAAWPAVCRVLMNVDEFITRE
jgi:hypothetical protein